jgi:HEAT repeat protein
MEKEKLESQLIDYIDGNLSDDDRAIVEEMLAKDEAVKKLYVQLKEVMDLMDHSRAAVPTSSLKQNFEKALQAEISRSQSAFASPSQSATTEQRKAAANKQIFFQPWILRVAAAVVLVMVGVAIGNWISVNRQNNQELARLKEEVETNKKIMLAMLENQQSASQRVMGATVAYDLNKADDDIVNVLIKTMNEDPNTNVRLAALEALGKFYQQDHVRKALLTALPTQKDPMVQIALIRLLVQMKEKQVVNELQKITRDENVMKAVKDEAHSGILKLS